MRNKKRVLQLLFDHGIDLDCRCETGKTPIHYAAQYGGRFGSYVETISLKNRTASPFGWDCALTALCFGQIGVKLYLPL